MAQKTDNPDAKNLLADLIASARKAGADAADALMVDAAAVSVTCRLGKVEKLERAESTEVDLRVLIGKKQAIISSTNRKPEALKEMVERVIAMARTAPEDEFAGVAPPEVIAKSWQELEMFDASKVDASQLIEQTKAMEDAARGVEGITNSEGAEAAASDATITLAASNGFAGQHGRTHRSLSVSLVAGDGTAMEQDYDYASRVFGADLPKPESIGKSAGIRTVKKLNSRKMPTAKVPIFFDPRIAGSILGHLSGAISGSTVARGTSFLKDKMGQKVFPDHITIIDDPLRARSLRSYPFDGEGLLPKRMNVIDKGVLTSWFLDLRSARQLKLQSTGHASRSSGGLPSPSPSNLYMEAGKLSPADLMRDIKQGFYVTALMGYGVNGVTGDYSRGASGFWIENGAMTFPVSEMTIAGNLKDMFLNLTPANDLEFNYGVDAPTLRIEGMTAAGL